MPPKRFLDLGNMMLAMVLLWAYLSFDRAADHLGGQP